MISINRTLLFALMLSIGLAGTVAGQGTADAEKHWADLAGADEITVVRAILGLSKNPDATVAFLRQALPPVKADPERVKKLLAELDSDQFAVRRRAVEELEYLGKYVKADLEKALGSGGSLESKQQIQKLLDRLPKPVKDPNPLPQIRPGGISVQVQNINGQQRILVNGVPVDGTPQAASVPTGPSMTWVRAVRAIALLEHIGTSEARAILERLASGEAEALPTEQARAALARLDKR